MRLEMTISPRLTGPVGRPTKGLGDSHRRSCRLTKGVRGAEDYGRLTPRLPVCTVKDNAEAV